MELSHKATAFVALLILHSILAHDEPVGAHLDAWCRIIQGEQPELMKELQEWLLAHYPPELGYRSTAGEVAKFVMGREPAEAIRETMVKYNIKLAAPTTPTTQVIIPNKNKLLM